MFVPSRAAALRGARNGDFNSFHFNTIRYVTLFVYLIPSVLLLLLLLLLLLIFLIFFFFSPLCARALAHTGINSPRICCSKTEYLTPTLSWLTLGSRSAAAGGLWPNSAALPIMSPPKSWPNARMNTIFEWRSGSLLMKRLVIHSR